MDVLNDLHADFAQALREASAAVQKLGTTWKSLLEHIGVDAEPVIGQAETDAAEVADTVKTDGQQLASAGAGAVESAVTQTVTSAPPTTSANPTGAVVADVTTPPTGA